MKYGIIAIFLLFLLSCSNNINNNNDIGLNIDIYQNDMTYQKFKQYAIEYAENSTYPSLNNE